MEVPLKRTHASSNVMQNNTPDELLGKGKILLSSHTEHESSTESLLSISHSVYNPTDSELSSESEFEEHDYCLQKKNKVKVSVNYHTMNMIPGSIDFNYQKDGVAVKTRRPKCNSKNAVIARTNRLKKKKYIENLETRNAKLEAENVILKDLLNRRVEEVESLNRETANLRNVIRNSTEIGSLLKCIHLNTNLHISSSLLKETYTDPQVSTSDPQTLPTSNNDEKPTVKEEAFVAGILWGMALHTFCQPYKLWYN